MSAHVFQDLNIYSIHNEIPSSIADQREKKNLVFIRTEENQESDLAFLQQILNAAKINHADLGIVPISSTQAFHLARCFPLQDQRFLSFGIPASQVGLHIHPRLYYPALIGSTTLLFADDLTTLASSPQLKKKLWMSLQKIFLS